jgi:hypothetical protein
MKKPKSGLPLQCLVEAGGHLQEKLSGAATKDLLKTGAQSLDAAVASPVGLASGYWPQFILFTFVIPTDFLTYIFVTSLRTSRPGGVPPVQ